jgi:hypothetical protein
MTIIYERVRDAADQAGRSRGSRPTLEYDPLYWVPGWTGEMLIEAIYNEVRRRRPDHCLSLLRASGLQHPTSVQPRTARMPETPVEAIA